MRALPFLFLILLFPSVTAIATYQERVVSQEFGCPASCDVKLAQGDASYQFILPDPPFRTVGLAGIASGSYEDKSGNGNTVIPQGSNALTSNGHRGFGMQEFGAFSSTANVTNATNLNPTCAWSMGGWFNVAVTGTQALISLRESGNSQLVVLSNGSFLGEMVDGATGTFQSLYSTTQNHIGNWLHIIYSYDCSGSHGRMYVNGVLNRAVDGIGPTSLDIRTNVVNLGHRDGALIFLNGTMDDIILANRTLPPQEVILAMNGQRPGAISGYYDFEGAEASSFVNESLYVAKIETHITDSEPISTARSYRVTHTFNGSNTLSLLASYEKRGWGIVSWFNAYYSLQQNGVELCSSTSRLESISPILPQLSTTFDFNLRGSYNSAVKIDQRQALGIAQDSNISGEFAYDNPYLLFTWTDKVGSSGILSKLHLFSLNSCNMNVIVGGGGSAGRAITDLGTGVVVSEMTSAPSVTITTTDNSPKDHFLEWQFTNATVTIGQALSDIRSINSGIATANACHEGVFHFLSSACVITFLGRIVGIIFDVASAPLKILLDLLPGGAALKAWAGSGWGAIVEIITILGSFLLLSGPNFPIGGVLMMILIWALSLGFLIWGTTGDAKHIVILPWLFVKLYVGLLFYLTIGLFVLLPIKMYEIISNVARG